MAGLIDSSLASRPFSKASRVERGDREVGPALRRGEVDHHHVVEVALGLEAPKVVGDDRDRLAVVGRHDAVGALDVLAELGAAHRRPRLDALEHLGAVLDVLLAQHAVTRGRGGEIVVVEVPAGEDQILVVGQSGDGETGQRQSVEAVRSGFDHLDARDGSGGNCATHANERNADTATGLHAHWKKASFIGTTGRLPTPLGSV